MFKHLTTDLYKKLSHCLETARRESWTEMTLKVMKSSTNRKLLCAFLLVVYNNFCRIAHHYAVKY